MWSTTRVNSRSSVVSFIYKWPGFSLQYTFPILFADDSNLFISGNDADLIMKTLNTELKEISLWLKANKLSLNIKKTHFMIFSSKNKPHPDMNINIDGEIINETSKTKFLGVIIDTV